jgi:hypothetical protein
VGDDQTTVRKRSIVRILREDTVSGAHPKRRAEERLTSTYTVEGFFVCLAVSGPQSGDESGSSAGLLLCDALVTGQR